MEQNKAGILSDPSRPARPTGRLFLLGAGALLSLAVVSALATVPGHNAPIQIRQVVEQLGPHLEVVPLPSETSFARTERIAAGDTLPALLFRLGVTDDEAIRFIASTRSGSRVVRNLRAGRSISASVGIDGTLHALRIPISDAEFYSLARVEGQLRETPQEASATTVVKMASGTISSSLFAAADEAGLPDAATIKLAELFGTEIDFHTDLRRGDSFSVVYEVETRSGAETSVGRILAAEFVNRGKRYTVVHFHEADGSDGYYTADGRNLKQAFLRSPLEFSRVTSGFAMRFHPIQKAWRQHKGVDFGATTGTAIKATSNGAVEFVGKQGGYGNVVILRHGNRISTLYAHMSRFASGLRPGDRVSQGDVIGYVGSTGWATGPHLHYEFRKNGEAVNPMTVALPSAEPLAPQALLQFREVAQQRLDQLAMLNYAQPLAQAD